MKTASLYKSPLDETIDSIVEAKNKEIISDTEMSLLLGIVVKKSAKKEVAEYLNVSLQNRSEKRTLLMQWENRSSQIRHA